MGKKSTMVAPSYLERFASQTAVLGKQGQQKLRDARVHIAGLGGLGNLLALFLSTTGVGYISANDPQRLELENLGRFVCGEEPDIDRDKVIVAARFLHRNRHLVFDPVVATNESARVIPFYTRADWIFSCASTISARIAVAHQAVALGKPIIDVGVSDGRVSLTGSIKYWLPQCADWSACPACYISPNTKIPRNEGLLFTILAATSALATHVLVNLATGHDAEFQERQNCIMVEMSRFQIESLAVLKRRRCPVCSINLGMSSDES